MNEEKQTSPVLEWEFGTAYELLISLYVLHMPDQFGVRAAWAAGIRSRIPAAERKLLEDVVPFLGFPLAWIHNLPEPRDAISVLWALKQTPPAKRILKMTCVDECKSDWDKMLMGVIERSSWNQADLDLIRQMAKKEGDAGLTDEKIARFLDRWAKQDELGEGYISALQAYHQAFFEEEEKRLQPILQTGMERARQLATKISTTDLFRELSQGVELGELAKNKTVIIIPAYWTTPLILFEPVGEGSMLFFFGARPADMAAIPGEMVPDSLLRVMKALGDTTRLKILHYLSQEELSPSELARRLHLRAPTVTHHLSELRLSGLVNLTIKDKERRYRTREESLEAMCVNLKAFLHNPPPN